MMKKPICLIICWYGELPYYYKLWERSCSYNKDIDFIIFTDQDYKSDYSNIIFHKKNLSDINKLLKEKLGDFAFIEKPYKFCDYRPAYGIIFEDYIKQYDYWGHCDMDQIFGDIKKFINKDILDKNIEKINQNGHFTLYKNNYKINNLFKEKGAIYPYEKVFSSKDNFAFDEMTGINKIVAKKNITTVNIKKIADIDVRHKRYIVNNHDNYKKQIFYWENGKVYRSYIKDDKILVDEFMYIHFQKKKPLYMISNEEDIKSFYINSDGFIEKNKKVSYKDFEKYNLFINDKFEKKEKKHYIVKKLYDFFSCSISQKRIWIKQKIKR